MATSACITVDDPRPAPESGLGGARWLTRQTWPQNTSRKNLTKRCPVFAVLKHTLSDMLKLLLKVNTAKVRQRYIISPTAPLGSMNCTFFSIVEAHPPALPLVWGVGLSRGPLAFVLRTAPVGRALTSFAYSFRFHPLLPKRDPPRGHRPRCGSTLRYGHSALHCVALLHSLLPGCIHSAASPRPYHPAARLPLVAGSSRH